MRDSLNYLPWQLVGGAHPKPYARRDGIMHGDLAKIVCAVIADQPVTDLHTHCYGPKFGHCAQRSPEPGAVEGLLRWGIDELVTYHYLVAEVYRVVPAHGPRGLPYDRFWAMSKPEQADHIWKHLFVERTPLSEACRGVLTTITKLGLDPNEKTLDPYRRWFAQQEVDAHIDRVMELANVESMTMTNEVFSGPERGLWLADPTIGDDRRFRPALRIDPLLCNWDHAAAQLRNWGYDARPDFRANTIDEVKRFLNEWLDRTKAIYAAASLPPDFCYPAAVPGEASDRVIRDILVPVLAQRGLPWALMIGARRHDQVNPALRDAGDLCGKADILAVVNLCREFSGNKFLVTMLSLENQHELSVAARKFGNLLVFGCWWFLNNPSIVEQITRQRIELLGTSFVAQHSDARILDQLIYKWDHCRRVIARVLTDKYTEAIEAGYHIQRDHIQRDARLLLRDNFHDFCGE